MENIIESLIQSFEVSTMSMVFVTIFLTWTIRKFFGGDMTFYVKGKKLDLFPLVPFAVSVVVVFLAAAVLWNGAPTRELLFYAGILGAVASGLYSQYKAVWEKPNKG